MEWPARFARTSDTIDPKTRTIGVIVAVDGAYAGAQPGGRPPLTKGMFVEIEVRTCARDEWIVVPRAALHDGRLYLAGSDGRLNIQSVTTGLVQGDLAAIAQGIETGQQIVVSDLVPAIQGMLLAPRGDDAAMKRLRVEALGEAGVR